MMDARKESGNTKDLIRRNNESDSIETDENDPQTRKQREPKISIVRGMMMQGREERENAEDLFVRTKYCSHIRTVNRRRPTDEDEPSRLTPFSQQLPLYCATQM
jgi:hypothetical protein